MINFDDYANENKTEHNSKWPYIPDHPYRLLNKRFWIWKTNALLNLINKQPDIDQIYLCTKDPYEARYHISVNKRETVGLKHFNDQKVFIEYPNGMQDVYKNIDEYNPGNIHWLTKILMNIIDIIYKNIDEYNSGNIHSFNLIG